MVEDMRIGQVDTAPICSTPVCRPSWSFGATATSMMEQSTIWEERRAPHALRPGKRQCPCSRVYELLEKGAVIVINFGCFNFFASLDLRQAQWPPQDISPVPLYGFKYLYTGLRINIYFSLSLVLFSFSQLLIFLHLAAFISLPLHKSPLSTNSFKKKKSKTKIILT